MAYRVQLTFGCLVASRDGSPGIVDLPRSVELEVREHARSPWSSQELAELVGMAWARPEDVVDRVLRALAVGDLAYRASAPAPMASGDPSRSMRLADIAGDEPEQLVVHTVHLELVGLDEEPISGAAYRLVDPDGRTHRGRLDAQGRAEITGIRSAGNCKVSFPDFDRDAWSYVSAHPL